METKLLRKPWIAHALCSLLDRNRQPSVACAIVQLIQVEGAGAAIVSDRFHFIKVQFTAACIESFGRRRVRLGATTTTPCARSLHAINGGFLHLRTWHFRFDPAGAEVALLVQAFDFVGAEQTYTCGEPVDVHSAAAVRQFQAVLPRRWSYKMDRHAGFGMCHYDECAIPAAQQDLLDKAGWAPGNCCFF